MGRSRQARWSGVRRVCLTRSDLPPHTSVSRRFNDHRFGARWLKVSAGMILLGLFTSVALASPTALRLGYAASMDPAQFVNVVVPLMDKLRERHPELALRSVELHFQDGNANQPDVDLMLLSSTEAPLFANQPPLILATLGEPQQAVLRASSVFVVKDESPWKHLEDLKGKRVAALDPHSFDGWLIAMNAIAKRGFTYSTFFAQTEFTHWQFPDVITLVQTGQVDVGILPRCTLEKANSQSVKPLGLRVIDNQAGTTEGCQRSTDLFPGLQLLALPHVDPLVVKAVLEVALMLAPQADGTQWLVSSTAPTDSLLKNLRLGPYASLPTFSWRGLWERYRFVLSLGLAMLLILIVDFIRVNHVLKRKSRALEAESEAKIEAHRALQASQERLSLLERASLVNQLSALIAHDLKQPLTIIVNYLSGLLLLRQQNLCDDKRLSATLEKVLQEAYRMGDIIERVREVHRRDVPEKVAVSLSQILSRVQSYTKLPLEAVNIELDASVKGHPLELELVLLNLIRNAQSAACEPGGGKTVHVSLTQTQHQAHLTVEDNGPPMSDAVFSELGHVTKSTKPNGLGYGLAIATAIVEAHGGHLTFTRIDPQGLRVTLTLPIFPSQETHP